MQLHRQTFSQNFSRPRHRANRTPHIHSYISTLNGIPEKRRRRNLHLLRVAEASQPQGLDDDLTAALDEEIDAILEGRADPGLEPEAASFEAAAEDDEGTEAGMPEHLSLTRAAYKRKAALLVELLAALQAEAAGQQVLQQALAAFAPEFDEALLHMLARRLESARKFDQDAEEVAQLELLQSLLQVQVQRAGASPAMRLLDEVMDMLGEEEQLQQLPGARERADAIMQRLHKAFTGSIASGGIDIFAAASALAADKAAAAEALAVEFVPQATFVSECTALLQQAESEMDALSKAVTEQQSQLQQIMHRQPELLQTPEAKAHMQRVAHAEDVLQQRKVAVAQLAYVLALAHDLQAG